MTPSRGVKCVECGAQNREDRLFCAKCGAYLGEDENQRAAGGNARSGAIAPYARKRRSNHVLGILLLVLFLVVAGVTVLLVLRQYEDLQSAGDTVTLPSTTTSTLSTTTSGSGVTTTGTTTGDEARIFPTAAKASSSLPPTDEFTYGPANLSDNDLATAWNEGASGDGVGEWLSFSFNQPIYLSRIDIANGYQRDQKRFSGNERVRTLRIEYSNGSTQEVQLYDDMGYQQIEPAVSREEGISSIRLTILSVYPGDSWEDAALSEIRFVGTR